MATNLIASSSDAELQAEQLFVDRAYARLDAIRAEYAASQTRVTRAPNIGNAQGYTEKDALISHFADLSARLAQVEDKLVFGRLDTDDDDTRYIGRAALSQADTRPLLIDWRAPAARPFYQATALNPEGVVRRRHIALRQRTITSLEDELFDAHAARERGLHLQGEGALLSALNQTREGRMGDIVSTIQAEQDKVIRTPDKGIVVVQGGPGTGKTAVALHRAAYLLYTERERLSQSGVLILGPSNIFLRYIEQVLPSLGESGVVSRTMSDLLPGIRATAVDSEHVTEIKGRPLWEKLLRNAVRAIPRIPTRDITLNVWNRSVVLTRGDIKNAQDKARRSGTPHNVAREVFALHLVDVLAKRIIVEASSSPSAAENIDTEEIAMWRQEVRDSRDARREINLAWMPMTSQSLLDKLLSRPLLLRRLRDHSNVQLSDSDIDDLLREPGSAITVADIPLLDEIEELLGTSHAYELQREKERRAQYAQEVERARTAISSQGLGGGIVTAEMLANSTQDHGSVAPLAERAAADRTWTYGHIVIDEAQELTPMGWRALLRRCPSRSFTVAGDLDQRRGHARPSTWAQALGPASRALSKEFILSISYRTPRSLMKRAHQVMDGIGAPVNYPLTAVRDVPNAYSLTQIPEVTVSVRETPRENDPFWHATQRAIEEESLHLAETSGSSDGRIVILVSQERAVQWDANKVNADALDYNVSIMPAAASKGLEFDTTIVVAPQEIAADGPGDLFVALTRSTQRLHVVSAGKIMRGLDAT